MCFYEPVYHKMKLTAVKLVYIYDQLLFKNDDVIKSSCWLN